MFNAIRKKIHTIQQVKIMKNKSYSVLIENIERKERLGRELKTKQEKLSSLSLKMDGLGRQLLAEKNAIAGYSDKNTYMESYPRLLKAAEEKLSSIEADMASTKSLMAVVNKEIIAINTGLSECEPETDLSDVLEHQKAIETEQVELDKYQALIDDQQSKISAVSVAEDKVTPLIRKREELLADIALGKAKAEMLGLLDSDIDRARQEQAAEQSNNENITTDARNTIAGLERRTDSIKARIAELNHLTPGILDCLFMSMAKQSAEDFSRIAQEMAQKLTELAAMDAMIPAFGMRSNTGLFPRDWWVAQIPNIGSMTPCAALNGDAGHYFNARNGGINVEDEMLQLKQDMINQGINL